MKSVLVVGNLFHGLESEMRAQGLIIDNVSFSDALFVKFNGYDVIVFVGMNVLLNCAQLELIKNAYAGASKDTEFFWWTHEPFWDYRLSNVEYLFGRKTHIFNCYNDSVYFSPFSHYFGVGGILWRGRVKKIDLPDVSLLKEKFDKLKKNNKIVCAYATCFHDFRLSVPHSIVELRNDTIKKFSDGGICDVYGKNWTGNWDVDVVEETRAGYDGKSWGQIKVEHSRDNYLFSICMENSLIKNYVTEKFAQAIESNLLPIYFFGNGLEDYFDTSAAISITNDPRSVVDAIDLVQNMSFDTYLEKLTSLTEDYNNLISKIEMVDAERLKPAKYLVKKIIGDN